MKKTKQIVLSLIMPRKMAKYRNMHYIFALFIYILGMFLALGSQFMMSEKFVAKDMERTSYDSVGIEENPKFTKMQKFEFSNESDITLPEENTPKITSQVCMETFTSLNGDIDVKLYFDENYDDTLDSTFMISDTIYKELKINQNKRILYIFTKNKVYYTTDNFEDVYPTKEAYPDTEFFEQAKKDFSKQLLTKMNSVNRINEDENGFYDEFETIFSKIRRLKNVDKVGFVNELNEKVGIDIKVTSLKTNNDTNTFDEYIDSYFATFGIYHLILQDNINGYNEDGSTVSKLDVTIVIDVNMDVDDNHKAFTYFDYEGYMKQTRVKDTTYILCVYSNRRFFFVYDLCQKWGKDDEGNDTWLYLDYNSSSIFEKTNGGNYKYYLPADLSEISYNIYGELDTTLWTREVNADDTINFETNDKIVKELKPVNRHQKNLEDAVYTNLSRSYQYSELVSTGLFEYKYIKASLNIYLNNITNAMIAVNASSYELIYGIMAFGIFILFPLILILIVWLMSKKLFMKKFRQYYAIGAVCYAETGLIAFILGFFIPFDKFALYFMLFQAWYFIFVTFRINTDPQYSNDENNNNTPNEKKEEKLEFKKISNSNTSQIG